MMSCSHICFKNTSQVCTILFTQMLGVISVVDRSCQDEDLAAEFSMRINKTPSCLLYCLGSNKLPMQVPAWTSQTHTHNEERFIFPTWDVITRHRGPSYRNLFYPKYLYLWFHAYSRPVTIISSGSLFWNWWVLKWGIPCVYNNVWYMWEME